MEEERTALYDRQAPSRSTGPLVRWEGKVGFGIFCADWRSLNRARANVGVVQNLASNWDGECHISTVSGTSIIVRLLETRGALKDLLEGKYYQSPS